jgi:hypothetical protein
MVANRHETRREGDRVRAAARLLQARLKRIEIALSVAQGRAEWWPRPEIIQPFPSPDERPRLARALPEDAWRAVANAEMVIEVLSTEFSGGRLPFEPTLAFSDSVASLIKAALGALEQAQHELTAFSGFACTQPDDTPPSQADSPV